MSEWPLQGFGRPSTEPGRDRHDDDPGGVHGRADVAGGGFDDPEIADHVGYHPATVSEWLGRVARRRARHPPAELLIDERGGGGSPVVRARTPRRWPTTCRGHPRPEGFGGLSDVAPVSPRGAGPARSPAPEARCRSRPGRARSSSSTGRTAATCGLRWAGTMSCTASGRSAWSRGASGGGSRRQSTAPHPGRPRRLVRRGVDGVPRSGARIGWAHSDAAGRTFGWSPVSRSPATTVREGVPAPRRGAQGKIERPFRDLKETFLEELVLATHRHRSQRSTPEPSASSTPESTPARTRPPVFHRRSASRSRRR